MVYIRVDSNMIKQIILKITIYICAICFLNPQLILSQESPFPKRNELEGKEVGDFIIKPGTFHNYSADFGRILIPENRKRTNSRLMHLIFIRVHALEENTAEPVFLLNGGPGKSNIRGILSSGFFTHNVLVLVGYRGIDTSVTLESSEIGRAMTVENPLSSSGMKHIRNVIRSTYDRFKREGVDFDGYTVLEVVDDLDAVGLERHVHGLDVQVVAEQDREVVPEDMVDRPASPPCLGLVNDVVVNQRRRVDELEDGGELRVPRAGIAAEPGGEQEQDRPDAFPATDLGLRRALGDGGELAKPKVIVDQAEQWRPWRAYAVLHLWHSEE